MTKFDLLDLAEDYTLHVQNGTIRLYHATSAENAQKIVNNQTMYGKEDGLFFSSKPNGEIAGYGKSVVCVTLPISKIELDDQFSDELHFRIPCKPNTYYKVDAKLL